MHSQQNHQLASQLQDCQDPAQVLLSCQQQTRHLRQMHGSTVDESYHICYTGQQARAKKLGKLSEGEAVLLLLVMLGLNIYESSCLLLIFAATPA